MAHSLVPSLTGNARLFFVIADPVSQLKAQALFNRVFADAGIDAVVVPAQVRGARLASFVEEVFAVPNVGGLFVSIPHKTALCALLARVDDEATAAGAVNAVRRGADGRLEGALFDGAGCLAAMARHGIELAGRRVLLVGCGGAGSAIAAALMKSGVASIGLFDADPLRAGALVERLRALGRTPLQVEAAGDPAAFDVVVQATPLGLHADDPLPLDPARVPRDGAVFDILMTPQPSPLVRECRARGIHAEMGHDMLLQQVPAYLDYFGFAGLAAGLRAPGDTRLAALHSTFGADLATAAPFLTPTHDRRLRCE